MGYQRRKLDQAQALEAGVSVLADDDVIVDCYPERLGRIDDHLGHIDVRARRRGVARGMIVDQNDSGGGKLKGAFHDLAGLDRRVIDCTSSLDFVGNQRVSLVQKQNSELLA
jgi:hypothetical protein